MRALATILILLTTPSPIAIEEYREVASSMCGDYAKFVSTVSVYGVEFWDRLCER